MILIDTSVWIEFFRQNAKYIPEIESLLNARQVITIEPIFSELLYGVRQKRDERIVLSYWKVLPRIKFGASSMLQAAEFANKLSYYQLGIGLMDAIIVNSAMDGQHRVWTLDKKITSNIDKKYLYQ